MTLLTLFSKKRWLDLEDAWTRHMVEEGHEIEPILALLQAARERKEVGRLLTLIREEVEILMTAERYVDAAEIVGKALLGGGNPGELGDLLFDASEKAWSSESWWDVCTETTGFHRGTADVRKAWESFANLKAFAPDAVVYHPSGWGLGQVTSVDTEEREIKIRFAGGRNDHFPFSTAVDIFEVLETGDLRALVLLEPDRLETLIKKEPLEVLGTILRRHHGRSTVPILRNAMAQLGVAGPKFTAWWRKARKEAEKSEWFEVIGTATKAQIRMLAQAADPAESMRRQLERSPNLSDALSRVREILSGKSVDEHLSDVALEVLGNLANDESEPLPPRLASWMLIRENTGGKTPELMTEQVLDAIERQAVSDESTTPPLWALFSEFTALRDQERCMHLLKEGCGEEDWLDEASKNFKYAPTGMVKPLVEALLSAERQDTLTVHYKSLLARPMRNPQAFVALAELAEKGTIDLGGATSPQRLHAMLQLAGFLKNQVAASSPLVRAEKRLVTMLVSGEPSLIENLCRDCDPEGLRTAHLLVERGVDVALDRAFTHVIAEIAPEIFKVGERPFWEMSTIWSTREGLARRQAELKELIEVKIPANSEAIGKAASFGDLSENSEWDAALEEQRNLTTRAAEIEAEVSKAGLIESATLPEDMVAPGTTVCFRETESGEERHFTLLGPWDADGDTIISYRSPFAAGLLGKRKGQTTTLVLPSGELEVEILTIEPVVLGA
jgi:transcription elongation factor GreA